MGRYDNFKLCKLRPVPPVIMSNMYIERWKCNRVEKTADCRCCVKCGAWDERRESAQRTPERKGCKKVLRIPCQEHGRNL